MARIIDIEGIGDTYAKKFTDAGIATTEQLLTQGGSKEGRATLATKTGVAPALLLKWVNHADLFRIKGVAGQFAELLEAAGVDSVPELAQRNAENLAKAMADANAQKNLTRIVPTPANVQAWVQEAKTLPRAVTH